jgi:hypothetical protein
MSSPFNTSGLNIQSAAVGDLNNDGFIDVMAGFAVGYNGPSSNPDILFLNDGNTNNWSEIKLQGGPSNINGIGARVEIYGAWGKQIREVRSGESYGIMNSLMTHFGLGSNSSITKIVVKWPSGIVDEVMNPNINESITIIEGATLNISEFENDQFQIFPNPTTNNIEIKGLQNQSNSSYKLFDITGKLIQDLTPISETNNKVELTNLKSGVYFIHLFTDSKMIIHKIIKE